MPQPSALTLDERLILDHLADPLVAADGTGRIVYANRAVERLLGWPPVELVGRPLTVLQPVRTHEPHRAGFARYLNTRVPKLIGRAVRVPARRRAGTEVEVELTLTPLRVGGSDDRDLFVGTLRDLTERIDLERQIDVTRYLRASAEAAAGLTMARDRDQILRMTVETLVAHFDAALARAWLYDPTTETLRFHAGAGPTVPTEPDGRGDIDVAASPYLVARVARTRRPIVLNDLAADRLANPSWLDRERIVAIAGYPLLLGDELLGVLAHFARQPLRDEVVEALANFAAIVSGALNGAELLNREREARAVVEAARRRAALLAEASRAMAEVSLDLTSVLETVARLVAEAVGDGCIIRLVSDDGTRFVPAAAHHPNPAARAFLWDLLSATSHPVDAGLVGQVARSRQPLLIPALSPVEMRALLLPEFWPFLDRFGIHGAMVAPLLGRAGLVGTVMVWRDEAAPPYAPSDLAFLEELADRGALAIENARLFREQQDARARIQALAAERASVLGQIVEGVIITDPDGRIVFVNDAARRLHGVAELGTEVESYSATYHLLTLDGRPYPPEELPLARAVRHGETVRNAEWRIRRPDGSEVVAQGSAGPVVAADGLRLGSVLTARDVTDERAFDQQKDAFFLAAAHDLRTPLTSIKGWAQVLRRATGEPPRPRERQAISAIETQATAMQHLVDQLLETSNRRRGEPPALALADVDLVALVSRLVEHHRALGHRHELRLVAVDRLSGRWDEVRLEQIVLNLLGNAVKYSPAGGRIEIHVAQAGDDARLTVRDHGIGIPAASLPRIFDQFYRADNVSGPSAEIAGLGIGLASARLLAEYLGGRIDVASEEGRGSRFTLTLPLAGPSAPPG